MVLANLKEMPRSGKTLLLWLMLCIGLLEFAAYSTSWQYSFGFLEEFGIHVAPGTHPQSVGGYNTGFYRLLLASGRPVGMFVYMAVEHLACLFSVERLWIYRLLGIAGGGLSAALLAYELMATYKNRALVLVVAGLAVLSPAIAIQAVQGHVFIQPYAGILSYLAFKAMQRYTLAGGGRRYGAAAAVCMGAAACIYQPWAFFAMVPATISMYKCDAAPFAARIRLAVYTGILCGAGLALSASVAYASLRLRHVQFDRFGVAVSLLDKAAWFIHGPLPLSASGSFLSQNPAWCSGPFLALVILAVRSPGMTCQQRLLAALIAAGNLPVCYLPNLAVTESNVVLRTMPVLTCMCLALMGLAADAILQQPRTQAWRHRLPLLVGTLLLGAVCAAQRTTLNMAIPPMVEMAAVRDMVAHYRPADYDRILVVRPVTFDWPVVGDVFIPNGALEFALYDMTRVALREVDKYMDIPHISMALAVTDGPVNAAPREFVLDLRPAYRLIAAMEKRHG
jgi:hypothetical protein